MKSTASKTIKATVLIAVGIAIAAGGIYLGETDDAPGAALLGLAIMIGLVALAARTTFQTPKSNPLV